jgi:phenylacetate-CoA ligase
VIPGGPPIELSVLVPCFNEEGNLPELVERTERVFERRGIAGEIVLVNDGSRDGTAAQIEALAARHPNVVAVHHPTNRGIPAGWRSGLAHSRGRYVCTIDADLQYQPEAIALLYREMCFSKADLVQAWRSTLERYQYDFRYYMSRGLDLMLKFAFGMPEHDVKSGFVMYKREVFDDILRDEPKYYYFQHMITVIAKGRGYSLRQVETLFEERRAGQSFISALPLTMISRTLVDVGRGVLEYRLREPEDHSLDPSLDAAPVAAATATPAPSYPVGLPTRKLRPSRNAPRYLGALRRTQWLPADALAALQLRRLQRQLLHAYEHVGFWRETLQIAGALPEDIRSLDDVSRLPLLGRDVFRENVYFDLLSQGSDKRKIEKVATTGADGTPLGFYVDRLQTDMRWAATVRGLDWTGFRPGAPRLVLACDARPGERRRAGTLRIPAFGLDAEALGSLLATLRREPVALVEGDTEALALLAGQLAARGERLTTTAVLAWGQTLTAPLRAAIEGAFGGPVFDAYGVREVGTIAQECPAHAGLHVHAENVLVEIVRDGRPVPPGQSGNVVVTDLVNRAVPFIRYRLPDTAALETGPCPCGRNLPRLVRVAGRWPGAIAGASGRLVPAVFFSHLFGDLEYAVRRYQVVQDAPGRVDVRVVCRSRFGPDAERRLAAALATGLGDETAIRIERVEHLADDAQPCVGLLAPSPFPASSHASPMVGTQTAGG